MKLENQVCSLDLAKALKELKVKQKSVWWWVNITKQYFGEHGDEYWPAGWHLHSDKIEDFEAIAAPTVAELINKLPYNSVITKGSIWRIDCLDYDGHYEKSLKLADAIAKKLIWLIENKHINPED